MRYEIRAMSFSEILDTGFRLLRDHFVVLLGIGFVLYGPMALIGEAALDLNQSGRTGLALAAYSLLLVLFALFAPIVQGAMTLAIAERYLGGQMGFVESYRGSLRRTLALVGTYLLLGLGTIAGFILLVIPGFYLIVAWMLTSQIVMLEEIAGPSALGRSWRLLKGNMLRALGVSVVAALIMGLLTASLQFLLSGVAVVGSIASAIAQSASLIYYTAVSVVLYFDLRCRKENFDIEMLAQAVEAADAPSGALGQEP